VPRLSADPDKLEQAFLNLFLNAIDAMPSGGRLKVSTRASNGCVQIEIGDSGMGIPPQIKNKLFKPFTTTKEGGLGLGLSVVHRIVEGHKGRIAVESTPEHGTTFTISLPLENHQGQ
jgi:signal transduction histidine kinase